jgi:Ca-activated chloride channel family protein
MREMTNEFAYVEFLEKMRNELERKLGSLRAGQGAKTITLPLDSVDIKASVVGRVTEVTITQVFKNPYSEHLEAEYIFPLAGCSSVNAFKMHVAGRTVTGTIQERRAAREEYQRALSDGKRASLLEQERDDVFTMQVGNIPPNEKITVEIKYTEKLEFFEDGTTELRLPLVVAPRYVPGEQIAREQVGDGVNFDTDMVPDASRVSPPRLAEGVNPDVQLSIAVELIPEQSASRDRLLNRISNLSCSQHAVKSSTEDGAILVTLAKANELLNRDFVLKWKLVGERMTSSVVLYRKAGENGAGLEEAYGMLSLVPPAFTGARTAPRDVVFLVDRSGSMMGDKMAYATRACSMLLSTLGPDDRFAINAFDDFCDWFSNRNSLAVGEYVNASLDGIETGSEYLRAIYARGGTELAKALGEALNLINANKSKGRMPVIVILTDGQVANESQIYKMAQHAGRDTRIFTIGIDTAINSPLLKRLASLAGGTSTFVGPGSQLEDALINVGREIGAPLVTDLKVESLTSGINIENLAPGRLRDLFAGRTSDGLFRIKVDKDKWAPPRFKVTGKMSNGRKFSEEVAAQLVDDEAIARLWAREYIKELEDDFRIKPARHDSIKKEIIELSLKFSVLTKFTAFVAVDEAETVNQTGELRQVVQPVHYPDQWELQSATGFWGGSYGCASPAPGTAYGAASFGTGALFGSSADPNRAHRFKSSKEADSNQAWGAPSYGAWDVSMSTFGSPVDKGGFPKQMRSSGTDIGGFPPVPGPPPAEPNKPSGPDALSPRPNPVSQTDSSISSVWSTMKKLFKSSEQKANTPNGAPVNRVINALTAFREGWVASWVQVGNGILPDADQVERIRKELVEALSDHPVGFEVPLLNKFLRSSAIDYVAALQASDVTASALFKSRSRFHDGFVDAMVEAETAISQVQGRQGAFWESNV